MDPFGCKHSTLDPSNSVICLCRWGPGTAELENPCTKLCYSKAPVKRIPPEGQAAAALVTWLLLQHGTLNWSLDLGEVLGKSFGGTTGELLIWSLLDRLVICV